MTGCGHVWPVLVNRPAAHKPLFATHLSLEPSLTSSLPSCTGTSPHQGSMAEMSNLPWGLSTEHWQNKRMWPHPVPSRSGTVVRGQRTLAGSGSAQNKREAGPEHAWTAILLKLSPGPGRDCELQPDHTAILLSPCPCYDNSSLLIWIYFLIFRHIHIYFHSDHPSTLQMRISGQGGWRTCPRPSHHSIKFTLSNTTPALLSLLRVTL